MSDTQSAGSDDVLDGLLGDFLDESDQLLNRLNENLMSLDEWVHAAGESADATCDENLLNEMFRAARGQTITEHIHVRRIREARHLLRETTLNLKQIADQCGFYDAAYLRRLFARHEGMSPSAYRKLYMRVHVNVR